MLTEKAITICLLEVLREYSDENHILSMGEIISKINARYGLNPDRRTFRRECSYLHVAYEFCWMV